jgi:hypothetical protein
MALVKCKECGSKVSTEAATCPQCGATISKSMGCGTLVIVAIMAFLIVRIMLPSVGRSGGSQSVSTDAPSEIAAPLIDIKALAGKSPKEVQAILGAPASTEKTKYGPKLTFKESTIEIVFIAGKADWICFTPKNKKAIPFTKAAMSQLGLPDREPTFSNEHVIRWEPCGDYVSVSLHPRDPGNTWFAYVKVATK